MVFFHLPQLHWQKIQIYMRDYEHRTPQEYLWALLTKLHTRPWWVMCYMPKWLHLLGINDVLFYSLCNYDCQLSLLFNKYLHEIHVDMRAEMF